MKEGYVIRNQTLPHFITATIVDCAIIFYKKNVRKVGDICGAMCYQQILCGAGNYKVVSKGLIYIKKLALNTVRQVASVAGHELNHMADYVNGNYALWANQNSLFGNGLKAAHARSEIGAYGWEMGMGSPFTNYSELMLNYAKMTINNWKF